MNVLGRLTAAALGGLLAAAPLAAQNAGTVALSDPAYEELDYLEARGVVPRGLTSIRPLSVDRIAWIVADARLWLAGAGLSADARRDAGIVLDRLERRFGEDARALPKIWMELEAGGGRSPGRDIVDNGVGDLDVVLNPLWANRGGRAYGDRTTFAASARATVPLGSKLALGVGGRHAATSSNGLPPQRLGTVVEAAYLRASLGLIAIQVGRDAFWHGGQPSSALLFSSDAPPLDLIRLTTDRPVYLKILGDTEVAMTVADLGPEQNFPNAKLFAFTLSSRPTPSLTLDAHLINKQLGDGAPTASRADRIKDLSFFWDLFRRGRDYTFSEKLIGLDAEYRAPEASGLKIFGGFTMTDFDPNRVGDILDADTGYRLGLSLDRLGASDRHGVEVEGQRLGPLVYRHHQFTTGFAAGGFFQGSDVGPDGRRIRVRYRYRTPASGWSHYVEAVVESRSIDTQDARYTPYKDVYRVEALPHENRGRLQVGIQLRPSVDLGIDLEGGLEQVRGYGHQAGDDRLNGAVLLRFWRSF